MSNQAKGPICRQTYFNQGSYLRARDNEKQLCNVITEIENGTIIPYIVSHGGEIDGNLTVKGDLTVTGNLNVNGNLSYAGNISLGNSCSDIITVGGTSTFSCLATFSEVDINGGNIDTTTIGASTTADEWNLYYLDCRHHHRRRHPEHRFQISVRVHLVSRVSRTLKLIRMALPPTKPLSSYNRTPPPRFPNSPL